ncbi:MAG: acyl-CoA dehydrogenase family protein [Betaproteobacteria bacterium]
MDVLLTEEEQMVASSAREFLNGECSTALVRKMELDPLGYPPELWAKCAEMGWPGMCLPEEYGGQALPLAYLGLVLQEVGRAVAPVPLHSTAVTAITLARHAPKALCEQILPSVSEGNTILTWAFSEEDPRFVPESIKMSAVIDGEDVILSGRKIFVDNFLASSHCLVACRTAAATSANEGISLFLVDTKMAGISSNPLRTLAKDQQYEVVFDKVRIPKSALIGPLNHGWSAMEALLDLATVLLCTQMLGATRMDAEMAIDHAKFREAFGQPIGAFQSIQHMCADMIIWIDGGELLAYEALWKMDNGLPAQVEVSQAKAFCNEKCPAVARNSQSIHGGIGFMMEFDLHLWLRRITAWSMCLGTTFEHRERIAHALLDSPGNVVLGGPVPPLAA